MALPLEHWTPRVPPGPRARAILEENWHHLLRTVHPGSPTARELVRIFRGIGAASRELGTPGGPRPQICDRVARTGKLPYKSYANHGPSQKKQRHRAQTEPLRKKDGPASWALAGWVPESSIVLPLPGRAARDPKVDGKTRHFGHGGRLFPARCADFGPKTAIWPESPRKKSPRPMVF